MADHAIVDRVQHVCNHCGRIGTRGFVEVIWQNGTKPGFEICKNANACWTRALKKERTRQ